MPTSVSIGQRFTQLIQHLGLSKNAFAQSLDKTATVIQHLVDERNKPGYDLLCKVFETYPNVSKDWLLLGQGPMLVAEVQAPAPPAAVPAPAAANDNDIVAAPVAKAPVAVPVAPTVAAPMAPAQQPSVASLPPMPPLASAAALPAVVPAAVPAPAAAPDSAYFTAALQTQYLQHQLALSEQRNQHLLAQQQLMQQMVDLLQRAV